MSDYDRNPASPLTGEETQPVAYYCRGCGAPLPQGSSARFHPECLKADKRRRIAERRQRETQRLHKWLRRRKCPDCEASLEKLAQVNPGRSVEIACEASQGGAEPLNSQERLNMPEKAQPNPQRGSNAKLDFRRGTHDARLSCERCRQNGCARKWLFATS